MGSQKEVLNLARRRRTVRHFRPEAPPLKKLLYALKVAKEAPSGMNAQPWHFVLVSDPGLKRRIRQACEEGERAFYARVKGAWGKWLSEKGFSAEKPFLEEAPYLILAFGRADAPYWLQSTWIAIGYLLLALEEQGLGTVTYTPPNPKPVQALIGAPGAYKLQTILPVGFPDDTKPRYERKKLEEAVGFDKFG